MKGAVTMGLVIAVCLAGPARTQQEVGEGEQVHVVRPGDTLWELARRYLNDPFRWPEIFSVNRELVRDPHWIYPEDRLRIPGRGLARLPVESLPDAAAWPAGEPETPARTVFYRPEREEAAPVGSLIVATQPEDVPVVPPGAFYSAGIVAMDGEVPVVGELVELISPTVIPMRMPLQIQLYDRVLMRLTAPLAVGERVHLLRPEGLLAPYGRIHKPTGSAHIIDVTDGVATVEVDRFFDEVQVGDVAVLMPAFPVRPGVRPIPAAGLEGRVLAFAEPQPVPATEDLAYVNLGAASGVVEGDEFIVYLPAEQAPWGLRPEVEVARLQVVRAGALTSAARVIALEHPALEPGLPVRLVGKMP